MIIITLLFLLAAASSQRYAHPPRQIYNVFRQNEEYLLKVWVEKNDQIILMRDYELKYSLGQPEIIENFTLDLTNLQSNITLSASLFKIGPELMEIAHESRNLTRFQKVRKLMEQTSVTSYDPIDEIAPRKEEGNDNQSQYGLHVAKDFNLMVIHTNTPFNSRDQIPPNMNIKLLSEGKYTCGIDLSQMHIPFRSYSRVTEPTYNVTLHIFPYDIIRYAIFYSIGNPQKMLENYGPFGQVMKLALNENAMDEMKEMLFTNHIYLVASFFILSMAQTILRFFTIKQEYKFWRDIDKNNGVSLKTLFYELVFSVILTLYVYQYNSSKLIIAFSIIDIVMTLWKISRTFKLKFKGGFPFISLETTELYKKRQNIDSQAIWYLNYLLVPLMIAYLAYSLYSKNFIIKSYYIFLLDTSVAFIAIFGFIMMTPQLYLNYKLKSVDHLNWKGLIYRFINTLLDDLFAFMVTMPMLRRLMYFRDDVVFLGYIYQRWIYRVDYTRRAPESDPHPQQLLKQD